MKKLLTENEIEWKKDAFFQDKNSTNDRLNSDSVFSFLLLLAFVFIVAQQFSVSWTRNSVDVEISSFNLTLSAEISFYVSLLHQQEI